MRADRRTYVLPGLRPHIAKCSVLRECHKLRIADGYDRPFNSPRSFSRNGCAPHLRHTHPGRELELRAIYAFQPADSHPGVRLNRLHPSARRPAR